MEHESGLSGKNIKFGNEGEEGLGKGLKEKILAERYHDQEIFEQEGRRYKWVETDPSWPEKTCYELGKGQVEIERTPEFYQRLTGRFPDEDPVEKATEKYNVKTKSGGEKEKSMEVWRYDISACDEAVLNMQPEEWNRDFRSRVQIMRVVHSADGKDKISRQAVEYLLTSRNQLRQAIIEYYVDRDASYVNRPEQEAQARKGENQFGVWANNRIQELEQKLADSA